MLENAGLIIISSITAGAFLLNTSRYTGICVGSVLKFYQYDKNVKTFILYKNKALKKFICMPEAHLLQ